MELLVHFNRRTVRLFEQVPGIEPRSSDWKSEVITVIRYLQVVTTFGMGYHFYVNEGINPTNITGVSSSRQTITKNNVSFYPTKLIKRPDPLLPPFKVREHPSQVKLYRIHSRTDGWIRTNVFNLPLQVWTI